MALGVLVGSAILVGVIWVLTKTLGDHETYYQGKPLYGWVAQLNSSNAAASSQADSVLIKDIIPHLTEVMFHDTNDSRLRLTLVEQLNGLPGVNVRFTDADGRRAKAARDLGEFGPAARPAIPALLQALKTKDSAVHGAALAALGGIHCEPDTIIPLLINYLDDSNLNDEAAEALGNFGPAAKPALPKLVPLLKIADKDLHHAVVEALQKIDPKAAAEAGAR